MTAQKREQCSAATIYRDRHLAMPDHRYIVTAPDGRQYALCSGACLVSFAVLGALPADLEPRHSAPDSEAA